MDKNNSMKVSTSCTRNVQVGSTSCRNTSNNYQECKTVSINTKNNLTDREIYRKIISFSKD